MTIDKKYYIITHQKMPWKLPFEHKLVGVEGFSPDLKEGIPNDVISKLLDYETAFGGLRSLMTINNEIKDYPVEQMIAEYGQVLQEQGLPISKVALDEEQSKFFKHHYRSNWHNQSIMTREIDVIRSQEGW